MSTTLEPTPALTYQPHEVKRIKDRRQKIAPASRIALALLLIACVCAIAPFLWMVLSSLKTGDNVMRFPPQYIPWPIAWRNYWDVLHSEKVNFLLWTRNTLVIEVLSVSGTTLSSAFVAYGFAKIRFKGRGFLFAIMLSTMMIPFPVTMVSLFTIFRWLGDHTGIAWLGTFKPLWVPAWFGSAFNIFLLRQFFLTIPDELSEAARIDGCSELGIFLRVVLPALAPRINRRRPLRLHGHMERFSRSPHLPAAPRAIHTRPGPAEPAKPTRRHPLASADGRQRAGHPARTGAIFPGSENIY